MRARVRWTMAVWGGFCLGAPAAAQENSGSTQFAGNVALTSDYTFRGISQTLESVAIQGGFDVAGPAGLFLGVWGSSLNFGESTPSSRAHAEVDVFGGIARPVAGAEVDLRFTYYRYPGTVELYDYNFLELALGISRPLAAVTAGLGASWSPDFFGSSGTGVYLSGSLSAPVPSTPLVLAASLGRQEIEHNAAFGAADYVDWSARATLSVLGLDLGAAWVGTDLRSEDCFGGSELCDARVVFSVQRGM